MRRSSGRLALRGLAGLLALFLGLPVAVLIARAALGGALGTGLSAAVVLDALQLSLATTAASLLLTVAIGLPIAVVLAHARFRGSLLLETIVDLPIVLPPSVAGLAVKLAIPASAVNEKKSTSAVVSMTPAPLTLVGDTRLKFPAVAMLLPQSSAR